MKTTRVKQDKTAVVADSSVFNTHMHFLKLILTYLQI